MPRHRREYLPRHGAARREDHSGRGVRFDAAGQQAAGQAVASPPEAREAGVFRIRWARGTFLTPWFVLGAGLVVVALAALQSPHPVLSFAQPDHQTCRHRGCATHHSGSLTSRRHGVEIKLPGPRGRANPAATPVPTPSAGVTTPGPGTPAPTTRVHGRWGVTIGFRLIQLSHRHHRWLSFAAFITVQSSKKIGHWTLRFTVPGTHIDRVFGAAWRESARGDGGLAVGQPWPWSHADDTTVRIAVLGTGRPGKPTGCVFDRVACTFSR